MQEQRSDPGILDNRLGPSQFRAYAGFCKPLDNEAGVADDLDPSAQCPMEPGCPECRDTFAFFSRYGFEPPGLDLPVCRIKVAADLDRSRCAIGVPQHPAIRRGKTRVQDRELQKPAWMQYPVHLSQ